MADWITTAQAAEISGYHSVYLRLLLSAGKIKGQKWGRDWQISQTSLMVYLRKVEKAGKKRGPKSKG